MDRNELKTKTFSGVRWTGFSSVSIALLYLLQVAVLARYLDKTDFGLVSLAMVVLGFAQAFVDMGFSNAIIHKQKVTRSQLDTLYTFNIISGFIVFGILYLLSPFIAHFYNEPSLVGILFWTGLNFVIQPFGIQFKVLLQKELEFDLVAKVEVISSFIGFVFAVGLAINGLKAYSLVFGFLATSFFSSFYFCFMGIRKSKPRMSFNFSEIKDFLSFGSYQMGERMINFFNSQFDVIIIGKVLGTESLGVYTIAKQLVMRPAQVINPIVTKVTFPVMAKLQDNIVELKIVYLKTINFLSSINFPIYSAIFLLAPEIVFIVFGVAWAAAIPIVKILSVYFALRSTTNPIGTLLLARGRARLAFFWNFGILFLLPGVIFLGSQYGLNEISYALTIFMFALVIPNWYFQVRPLCHATFFEYHLQILKPAIIAILSTLIAAGAIYAFDSSYLRVIIAAGTGLISCLVLNTLFNPLVNRMIKSVISKK